MSGKGRSTYDAIADGLAIGWITNTELLGSPRELQVVCKECVYLLFAIDAQWEVDPDQVKH